MKNLLKSRYSNNDNVNFSISKFLLAILFVTVTFTSCNSDSDSDSGSEVSENKFSADVVQKLKQNFDAFELKNSKYLSEQNKFITEIYINNTLSGYLLQDDAKNNIGFSNITNSKILKYYDFITDENYSFDIKYSSEHKCNIPNFEKNSLFVDENSNIEKVGPCENDCQGALIACSAVTVIASVAIAASDGPLPLMDVLAASTYVAGMANCAYSNSSCLRGCN